MGISTTVFYFSSRLQEFVTHYVHNPCPKSVNVVAVPFVMIKTLKLVGRREKQAPSLQLLHSNDISGLDMVLVLFDLLLELVQGDLLILDDQVDLELLDSKTDSLQLGRSPDKTVLFDSENICFELLHVRLIIPK